VALLSSKPANLLLEFYTQAKEAYAAMVDRVRRAYMPERVHDGRFAAMMDVALVNDGPVTITIDSQAR